MPIVSEYRACNAAICKHVYVLQDFKTVLRDHEGTGDFIDVRTLVLVLRHKDLPHGQFRAESKGSNISYPDRRVSALCCDSHLL